MPSGVEGYLLNGERVIVAAKRSKWRAGFKLFPAMVYVTNLRLLVIQPTMLGMRSDIASIPLDKVSAVRLRGGLLSTSLEFTFAGMGNPSGVEAKWGEAGAGIIDGLTAEQAKAIIAAIEAYRQQRTPAEPGRPPATPERTRAVHGDLEKLLKDGLITKEEYDDYIRRHGGA